eukprot:TRINITY_DN112980_c0_g1_i1.p1 TRINITY_DN112980_c0_g1~~TRINITY_DN112980_c0_g1_i1.p1  ORF type:complete len:589 (+),score=113.77 TRINITY_DN112980_c0_g1_i1:67-1833(+)
MARMRWRVASFSFAAACIVVPVLSATAKPACDGPSAGACNTEEVAEIAVALEGGGFRALASYAGFFAGLLAATNGTQLATSGILNRFDTVTSNSGGSWFATELIYSASFVELLETMASSPNSSSAAFKAGWTDPWQHATGINPGRFNILQALARVLAAKVIGTGDEDTLYTLTYFFATGATWTDFIHGLLSSTAAIDETVRMGSGANSWAEGKNWIAVHSLVLPSASQKGNLFQGKLLIPSAEYYVNPSNPSAPSASVFPGQFSVRVGAGLNASALLPVAAASVSEAVGNFTYTAVMAPLPIKVSATSTPVGPDLSHDALEKYMGSLPVASVAAASSAFLGGACILGDLVDEADAWLISNADLTPWVSSAPDGLAFTVATEMVEHLKKSGGVNKGVIDGLAQMAIHGAIDGGYTDGTGISQAAAAGAREVVALLNSNASNDPYYVEVLFKDGPKSSKPGIPADLFPVFSSPDGPAVRAAFEAFHKLDVPATSMYLKQLTVGTIEATTAPNKYFGIEGTRAVTIHIINICSDMSIGEFEAFTHYDSLVQEVVMTLVAPSNQAFVQSTLLPLFRKAQQLEHGGAAGPTFV